MHWYLQIERFEMKVGAERAVEFSTAKVKEKYKLTIIATSKIPHYPQATHFLQLFK